MNYFSQYQFNINYKLLKKRDSHLAIKIETHPFKEMEPSTLFDDRPNLMLCDNVLLYIDEEPPFFDNNAEIIYVYGLGLGYYFDYFEDWLKGNNERELVFLEDDLSVMQYFLATHYAYKILSNVQVQIYYLPNNDAEYNQTVDLITSHYHSGAIDFIVLKSYIATKQIKADKIKKNIVDGSLKKHWYLGELLQSEQKFYHNYYHNIFELPNSYLHNSMKSSFKGIPAIICGAGPSLDKQIGLLKELGSKALILAGGSAINALTAQGVTPHFGGTIDPNDAQAERISCNAAGEMPYFYRSRVHRGVLEKIDGPKIFVSGGSGHALPYWINDQLNLLDCEEEIDEGHNVINFLTHIATFLGCSPIIFVGMDLAYTDSKDYSKGVYAAKDIDLSGAYSIFNKPMEYNDIYGVPTKTCWKWVQESEWYTEFQRDHPEVRLINATEGGIGFPEIENKSLMYTCSKYCKKNFDLKTLIQRSLKRSNVTTEQVLEVVCQLEASLKSCITLIGGMIEEMNIVQEELKNENKMLLLQTSRGCLLEQNLSEEVAYHSILLLQNQAFNISLQRHYNRLILSNDDDKHDYIKTEIYKSKLKNMLELAKTNIIALQKELKFNK